MFFKYPKNNERIFWTSHAKEKMRFYGLTENRIKKVLRQPKRKEIGIAPGTIALMQPTKGKRPQEIWLMYQIVKTKNQRLKIKNKSKIKIISAWRYPGKSPVGKEIPIPEDICRELKL